MEKKHKSKLSQGGAPSPKEQPQRLLHDFRSDTVTRPTPAMLDAMVNAPVGDDVWRDDPSVNKLQAYAAKLFGMEDALFCPSGTMSNQIAIKVHTHPGDELICADSAHVFCYEGGGIAFNSGVQARTLPSDHGRITASQIAGAINADDPHYPCTSLVCLENTTNKGGGALYTLRSMKSISKLCRERGLALHLDGARVFNAFVASRSGEHGEPYGPRDIGPLFDSISICLSKGLGCPVGSLLLGSADFINRARRVRKVMGGGMRQAGFLAGAGLYALRNHVDRLGEDHKHAQQLCTALRSLQQPQTSGAPALVESVRPVASNIVVFELTDAYDPKAVIQAFGDEGILISSMGGRLLRLVTHLDVGPEAVAAACVAMVRVQVRLGDAAVAAGVVQAHELEDGEDELEEEGGLGPDDEEDGYD